MANQDKDRVPDETLAPSSVPGISQAGLRPSVLYVRLWSAAGKRLDCRTSKSSAPLLSLVLDMIRASGGAARSGVAENAEFLAASFPDFVSAMQCARRIQWALEGLSENEPFRGAAAAILVEAADQAGSSGLSILDWDGADPGKVLVKQGVFGALDGVPGVTFGGATGAGYREWAWRSFPANQGFATDEQLVLGMLRAAGRSDPGLFAPAAVAADSATDSPTRIFTGTPAAAPVRVPETYAGDLKPSGASRFLRMPVVAAAVGLLLLVVAVVFFLTRKAPVQSAAPGPAAVPETRPVQSAPASAPPPAAQVTSPPVHANPTPASSKRSKPSDLSKKGAAADQAPTPVVSHCDLTEGDIQRSLARADRYMYDGDLSDARAAYQHVLGCPSARERAQAGLIRIQKIAAQSGAPN